MPVKMLARLGLVVVVVATVVGKKAPRSMSPVIDGSRSWPDASCTVRERRQSTSTKRMFGRGFARILIDDP
jgi:hypothetical protein